MNNLIEANDICTYHEVEYNFISSLNEAGLVELVLVDQRTFVDESELHKLEKMIRMHHELEINIAGIEAIFHLLTKIEKMQEDIRILKNRAQLT